MTSRDTFHLSIGEMMVPSYIAAQLLGSILASGTLCLLFQVEQEYFFGTTGELAGIAIGMTILVNVLMAGPVSGASMNPARSLGPAIVMHEYKGIWIYMVGPMVGTIMGGFAYNLIRFTDKPLNEITKSSTLLRSFTGHR
ncbi:hypothetical protein R6Q59_006654 [Mikania micrantha]